MFKNIGIFLLAVWMILTGLIVIVKLSFSGLPIIMAILAIGAGVMLLLGK